MTRSRQLSSRNQVGAWVVKGEPTEVWDYFASSSGALPGDPIRRGWTLGDSYRNDMIRKGDLIALWITGRRLPGIHEIGVVSGAPYKGTIDEDFLIDQRRLGLVAPVVPFTSHRLRNPLPRFIMKSNPVLGACEQMRAPKVANPTFFTPEETLELVRLLRRDDLRDGGWSRRLRRLTR